MSPILFLAQVQGAAPSAPFWPESVTGWLGLIVSIISLLGIAVGYGKLVQQINGLGTRVAAVEDTGKEAGIKVDGLNTQVQRVLDQHQTLIERIGEARGETVRCREDYVSLGDQLGTKIDNLRRELTEQNTKLRERLTAVETELKFIGSHTK